MTLNLKYVMKRKLDCGYFDNTANASNVYGKSAPPPKKQMTYDLRFHQE